MGFLALRCCACGMFQVKQQKKSSNKWCCTICNQKQSLCKVYGTSGVAKDVRQLVQHLNYSTHVQEQGVLNDMDNENGSDNILIPEKIDQTSEHDTSLGNKRSKWDEYLETNEEDPSLPEDEDLKYVTSIPDAIRNRKRKTETCLRARQMKAASTRPGSEMQDKTKLVGSSFKQTAIDVFLAKDGTSGSKVPGSSFRQTETFAKKDGGQLSKAGFAWGKENIFKQNISVNKPQTVNRSLKDTDKAIDTILATGGDWNKLGSSSSTKDSHSELQKKAVTESGSKWIKYLEEDQKAEFCAEDQLMKPGMNASLSKWSTPVDNAWIMKGGGEVVTQLEDELVTDDIYP